MVISFLLPFFSSLLAVSSLVFVHELGHLLAALLLGVDVEVFSVGIGPPLLSWQWREIQWQLGQLPFGGYLQLKEREQKPLTQLIITLAGPLANISLALVMFTILWQGGGRAVPFSTQTQIIGWVNPQSSLYAQGLRAGDRLKSSTSNSIEIDQLKEGKYRETVSLECPAPISLTPASYLVVQGNPRIPLQKGDRIVALDGQLVFSIKQLKENLKEEKVTLRVYRRGENLTVRVSRIPFVDVQMDNAFAAEIVDWCYERGLSLDQLWVIPYSCTRNISISSPLPFVDERAELHTPDQLLPGDQIVAVWNKPVSSLPEFLSALQTRSAHLVIDRSTPQCQVVGADATFAERLPSVLKATCGYKQPSLHSLTLPIENDILGIYLSDLFLRENHSPLVLCKRIAKQTYQGLLLLLFGHWRHLSGPVGMVQSAHFTISLGFAETVHWLGSSSLQLALINLLPIPLLDGGQALLALFEQITHRTLDRKLLERIINPTALLLLLLLALLTWSDLTRL